MDKQGFHEFYCPKAIKKRAKGQKKNGKKHEDCSKVKKGRRRCLLAQEEKMCQEKRRKEKVRKRSKPSKYEICTQADRDAKFGKGWRWNTRNCESLKKSDKKKCKKDKIKRCTQKEMKKSNLNEADAKAECKRRSKRKKTKSSKKKKLQSS